MSIPEQQHIVFICSRLDLPGGIERAIVNTANLLTNNGYRITLLVLDATADSFYPINPSIVSKQIPLFFGIHQEGNLFSRKFQFVSDIMHLGKELKMLKPTFVIATEYQFAIAAVLSGIKKSAKLASWEHHHYYELEKSFFWNVLFYSTYPRLHAIVCLNKDEQKLFQKHNKHVYVISNFCAEEKLENASVKSSGNTLLTVARLTHIKGIDLLLQVAAKVLQALPAWKWKLIGDGEMKGRTESFIEQNGLTNQLLIHQPITHKITEEYRTASLYVMTSRNECFPMTLLEAVQQALPCVAFDCETGPRAIINSGSNGILVGKENVNAMAENIIALVNDKGRLNAMSLEALKSAERFSPANIAALWKRLFTALL